MSIEYFLIGLFVGVLSMTHVFPEGKTFWQWIYLSIKKTTHQYDRSGEK